MGFVSCDARDFAGLQDSTLDNNVSENSSVTRKNCLCSKLNAADKKDTMGPLKLDTCRYFLILFYFFIEKVRQKYFFSSNTFQFIKKLEHELNEL